MWLFSEIKSLGDTPRHYAKTTPTAVALGDVVGDATYAELDERSNRIANTTPRRAVVRRRPPPEKWGERVVAAVATAPSATLSQDEVIAHCRSLIAGYKVPKQVEFLTSLPMTPTGKVKKGPAAVAAAEARLIANRLPIPTPQESSCHEPRSQR